MKMFFGRHFSFIMLLPSADSCPVVLLWGRKANTLQICSSTLRKHNHKCIIGLQSSEWIKSMWITTLVVRQKVSACYLSAIICCDYLFTVNTSAVNFGRTVLIQTGDRTVSGTLQNATCQCCELRIE